MSRGVLVIGGIVVAGATLALVLALGGGDSSGPSQAPKTQSTSSTTSDPSRPRLVPNGDGTVTVVPGQGGQLPQGTPGGPPPVATGPNAPIVTPRAEPRGQATADSPAGAGGPIPPGQDYVIGDVRVRDHRGGSNAPLDVPPNIHTPEGPRIDSTLTHAIGMKVRSIMYDCAAGTSRDGRGEQPRVEGQIVISVKAQKASVLSSVMQPRDVSAEAASTIKACLEPKIVGLTADAPNQADLDNYSIGFAMRIP